MIAALIVAAGRGTRAGSPDLPKQYVDLAGRPLLHRTLQPFVDHPAVTDIQVVIHPDDADHYAACMSAHTPKLALPVDGGATRQASVRLGLKALQATAPDIVLIHDAARPFVDGALIDRLLAALETYSGAIAALPATDTLKRARPGGTIIAETLDRSDVWRAVTPQAFRYQSIAAAHRAAAQAGRNDFTDDAAVAEFAGIDVALVASSPLNIKITSPGDFALAERLLHSATPDIRTGQGFDVHRFTDGDCIRLCGIDIPHSHRLDGHSDADVAMHALTDAILGAIGDGDIGQHFPPTDERWRGTASQVFLEDAVQRVSTKHGRITNVDITIICERPKIGPHRSAMRARLAEIMGLDTARISIKATTSEGLGFTGREEGIAALATATVVLPS